MWNTMTSCIKKVGKEELEETKGDRYKKKNHGGVMKLKNVLRQKKCHFKTGQ